MPKAITALIKPASSICNMNCSYCFYRDIASQRDQASHGIMGMHTAEQLIQKTLSYADGGAVTYCFQGGEPLFAGIDYFRNFINYVEQNNHKNSPISYSVQTNGLLLDDAFCQLFQKNAFLVGVSLDGKCKTHDRYRTTLDGKSTFYQVLDGIHLLEKYHVPFNILSVVTRASAKEIVASWEFYKHMDYRYLQFIFCLEPIGCEPFTTEYACGCEEYFQVQRKLFDLYLADNLSGRQVSVRHLDNLMARLQGEKVEQCDMLGHCYGQLVVEADGSVYPCDFYCTDSYLLGNICENTLEEIERSAGMRRFIETSFAVEEECRTCPVWALCLGGCRRERDYLEDGHLRKNMYCDGRKDFFKYVLKRCRELSIIR